MADVTYDTLDRLLGGRSKRETPCPFCSHQRKAAHRKSLCFGLMRRSDTEIVFHCMNCGENGKRSSTWNESGPPKQLPRPRRAESPAPQPEPSTGHLAALMWANAIDPMGTPVEDYWRFRKLSLPIPPSVRFHPTGGQGKPTLVHAAGMPTLAGDDWSVPNVTGVHRTFIDLTHEKGRSGKQALGEIKGKPCVCHINPESLALVIGEGLEKVTKYARGMGMDGWSACGKSFLPHLADVIPDVFEVVTILADRGAEREVDELASRIVGRGMEVLIEDEAGVEAHAGQDAAGI